MGTPVNLLLSPQKCQGVPFSTICQKCIALAAAPLALTPFVRNQYLRPLFGAPLGPGAACLAAYAGKDTLPAARASLSCRSRRRRRTCPCLREMGGAPRNPAPRNPAPRNHFVGVDCQTTDNLVGKNIAECRPLLGALPLSLIALELAAAVAGAGRGPGLAAAGWELELDRLAQCLLSPPSRGEPQYSWAPLKI